MGKRVYSVHSRREGGICVEIGCILASWQKITVSAAGYKIYIEGDGYAFDVRGRATSDPTPRGTLMRELAFGDDSPNVMYLARPCQYVKSGDCAQRHYAGSDDEVMPPSLIRAFVDGTAPVIVVDGASHNSGWEKIYPEIWAEQP